MRVSEHDPVTSVEDLTEYYRNTNPEDKLLVGIELERSGIYRDGCTPVTYEGYQQVFRKLSEEVGWEVSAEENGLIYTLTRGKASLTVEADGRPELAGSARENLHELSREFRLHDNELREIGNMFGIAWVPLGMQPFHRSENIPILPKKRYDIITGYVRTEGMQSFCKRNNGVHVNFSYVSEENMVAKAQTAFRVLPIVGAMFASSPFLEGKPGSHLCMRRMTATEVGVPERFSLPPQLLDDDFSFAGWIRHYIQFPVMIITEDGVDRVPPKSLTFEKWMREGFEGRKPTPADFDRHIKTFWSDVRLRPGYLEYRVADSTPEPLAMSLPAFLKGLIFDSDSWEAVAEITKSWTYEDVLDADRRAWKEGLRTKVKGRPLLSYAQQLITLANEKLHGFERVEAAEEDESIYLAPLKEQIFIREKSPAEELLELYLGEWNEDMTRVLAWCEAGYVA